MVVGPACTVLLFAYVVMPGVFGTSGHYLPTERFAADPAEWLRLLGGERATVTHFPPGASKWNPADHRLFSRISSNWAGKPLRTLETLLACIRGTKTVYNTIEDVHGRMIPLNDGDVVAGVLGTRRALRGYAGVVPDSGDGLQGIVNS